METAKVHSKSKHKSSKANEKKVLVNGHKADDDEIKNIDVDATNGASASNVSVVAVDETSINNNNNNNNNNGDDVKTESSHHLDEAPANTETKKTDEKLQKGILGYMDRQLKVQSISEPPRSPAQRSTRSSRSSQEKSPRPKRSKSESRRRRERKIIAAGEMEVRQANETLMRYLKQCSDFNDASLSGDLEINENVEDRRVHRKTKSQREKKLQYPRTNGMFVIDFFSFLLLMCLKNIINILLSFFVYQILFSFSHCTGIL
jgi:transmembrane protein 237